MNKILYLVCIGILAMWITMLTTYHPKPAMALTDTAPVTISVIVTGYIDLTFSTGSTIDLGTLTPGSPVCHVTGSVAGVTTNAANGYTLGIEDTSDTNSALSSAGTYIPDITGGTMTTPAVWATGAGFQGLGVSNFAAATTKNTSKWGTGTTGCDALNKWAAIPAASSVGHTVTGYRSGSDSSSWSWKLDTANTQKTGSYTSSSYPLFTATAVFS